MGGTKGAHCAAPSCCNYRKTCPELSFFRFPSEKKRCLKWIINTRRRDLEITYFQLQSKQYFSSNFVLCSAHFTDCCFMNCRRNKLVHDAIPSLFTITEDTFHLPYSDLLSQEYSAKLFKEKADEEMASVLEESRNVDMVIGKKLKEAHQQGQLDVNICFPHEHGSGALKPTNPETALPSTHKKRNFNTNLRSATTSRLLVRNDTIKPVQAPVGISQNSSSKNNRKTKRTNVMSKQTRVGTHANNNSKVSSHSKNGSKIENVSCQAPSINPYYLCCSMGCLSTSITSLLFPFPSNIQQAKVWLERCGRPELKGLLDSHGSVPHNFMLCDKHFKRSQFASYEKNNKALQTNAMPTLFSSEPEKRNLHLKGRQSGSTSGSLHPSLHSERKHDPIPPVHPAYRTESQTRLRQESQVSLHHTDTGQRERHLAVLASRTGSTRSTTDASPTDGGGVCAYEPCKRRRGPLYKFPQDPSRCLAWLHNTGYSNLPPALLSSSEDVSPASYRLCNKHFEPSCFFIINNTTKLLSYAVPTVFAHGPALYPCQHKCLAERYRKCPHDQCHQLVLAGVYESGLDDPDSYVDTKQALLWHETSLSSGPYIICDQTTVYGAEEEGEEELMYSDNEEEEDSYKEQRRDRPVKKIKLDPAYTMDVPPMEFDDVTMPEEEKLAIMSAELEHLKQQSVLLTHHLGRQRGARFRYRRALQLLSFAPPQEFTEDHALHYLKQALSKSTYEFFLCQRKHRKFPPWNFDSLQIPTIANRCGLGVRETLFEIFRMPTIRTFSRYRKLLRKDPSLVSDDHLLKNDLRRAYHRKLQRKRRPQPLEPATISTIIKKFIVKSNESQLSCGVSRDQDDGAVSERGGEGSGDDALYHHKKYNSPQKTQFVSYEETVAV